MHTKLMGTLYVSLTPQLREAISPLTSSIRGWAGHASDSTRSAHRRLVPRDRAVFCSEISENL
jgi:hypothetical protein